MELFVSEVNNEVGADLQPAAHHHNKRDTSIMPLFKASLLFYLRVIQGDIIRLLVMWTTQHRYIHSTLRSRETTVAPRDDWIWSSPLSSAHIAVCHHPPWNLTFHIQIEATLAHSLSLFQARSHTHAHLPHQSKQSAPTLAGARSSRHHIL